MTRWTGRLIALNIIAYFLTSGQSQLFWSLALVPATVLREPWTLVTYMFLHAGIGHLFFNMLALYFFGPRIEARIGSRNFLWLYTASGLGGAVLSLILAPTAAVVGASGAVFGILLAFARFWPNERIYLWFVLPIKARWFVVGLTVISLYYGGMGGSTVAHFAHLGGFAGGWLFLAWLQRHTRAWQRRVAPTPSTVQRVTMQVQHNAERWKLIPLEELHPINREEVERVLHKLEAHGAGSLTPDERAFLDRMS